MKLTTERGKRKLYELTMEWFKEAKWDLIVQNTSTFDCFSLL